MMPPPPKSRTNVPQERFSQYFSQARTVTYSEPKVHSVRTIAWNPTGTAIATGAVSAHSSSGDRSLRVWNPEKSNSRFSTELKGHIAPIEKVTFNPVKQSELCSVSSDGVLKLWDVRSATCIAQISDLGEAFTAAWAPDGSSIVVGNKADMVYVVDAGSRSVVHKYQQDMQTNEIVFCWSGKKVYVTTGEGKTRILTYPEMEPEMVDNYGEGEIQEFKLVGHTAACLSAALQPNGKYLATGGSESLISLWDTKDWICQKTLTTMTGPIRSLSFSFDSNYLSAGSDDGRGVRIWHVETGEEIHTIDTKDFAVAVAWAPLHYALAFNSAGTLQIASIHERRA